VQDSHSPARAYWLDGDAATADLDTAAGDLDAAASALDAYPDGICTTL